MVHDLSGLSMALVGSIIGSGAPEAAPGKAALADTVGQLGWPLLKGRWAVAKGSIGRYKGVTHSRG